MKALKKIIASTVLFAMVVSVLAFGRATLRETWAETEYKQFEKTDGDWRYKILEDGTAEITGYDGQETKLVIPKSIGGADVTEIGVHAFENSNLLESVIVPDGVVRISHEAFKGCVSLEKIEIPYSVCAIADTCFLECTSLSKFICAEYGEDDGWHYFTKDGSLYSNFDYLYGAKLMFYNTSKKDIIVEDFVGKISEYAFVNNKNINSISIPESIGMVIKEADKPMDIPICIGQEYDIYFLADKSGIYEINAKCAFSVFVNGFGGGYTVPLERGELHHATIRNYDKDEQNKGEINVILSVNYGSSGNANDSGSVKYKVEGYTCTYSGSGAIEYSGGCYKAKKIIIEEGITEIPYGFCNGNDTVEEIYIPDSVTSVGGYAFYYSSLCRIIGGNGIESIGIEAFSDTDWIRCQNKVKKDGAWYCALGHSEIICDDWRDFEEVYKEKEDDKNNCTKRYIELPDGTIMLIHGGYDSLSAIDGKKISSICEWADLHINNKDVVIPEGVEFIGWDVGGGKSLNTITFPSSLKYIYHNAYKGNGEDGFGNDGTLTSIILNQGLVKIGWGAFIAQPNLKSVVIPSSVTEIGEYAFGYGISEPIFGYEKYPDFTIYGYPNTAAEAYAKENGFTFIDLTDAEEPIEKPSENPTETPIRKPDETLADSRITFNTSGEFSPILEMTKEEALSAIAKYLSAKQLLSVKAGKMPLDIRLTVKGIDKSVSEADKDLIAKTVSEIPDSEKLNFKVLKYIDISLGAVIDDKELMIPETDGEVTVSIELEKPANENYKIVRIHGSKAEVIDAQLDKEGKRLTFKTDKFSTYVVIYSDLASGGDAPVLYIAAFLFAGLAVIAAGAAVVIKKFKVLREI